MANVKQVYTQKLRKYNNYNNKFPKYVYHMSSLIHNSSHKQYPKAGSQ